MPIRSAGLLFFFLLAAPSSVLADNFQAQVAQNLEQGVGLVREKAQLEKEDKQLSVARRSLIETGTALTQEQADLDRRSDEHAKQVTAQKEAIQKNQGACSGGNAPSGKDAVAGCNKDIDTLNGETVSINSDAREFNARQADLQSRFARYQQAAADWNKRDAGLVAKRNRLDGYLTNWLNFNYGFMAGGDFQAAIVSPETVKACGTGIEPIKASAKQPMDESAAYVLRCLKAIHKQYGAPTTGN